MKHSCLALVAALTSFSAFSQVVIPESDYHCKDLFEPRVERLQKSSHRRVVAKKVLKSSVVLSAAIPGAVIAVATGTGIIAGGIMTTFVGAAPLTMGLVDWIDGTEDSKLNGLMDAMSLQELMYTSEAEFMALLRAETKRALAKELEIFENQITHAQVVGKLLESKNEARLKNNQKALTQEEAIEEARNEIKGKYAGEIINRNVIVKSMEQLKKEGRVVQNLKYDEFRQYLIDEQEKFCPNEKPISAERFFEAVFPSKR